jgi:hypothetical protein
MMSSTKYACLNQDNVFMCLHQWLYLADVLARVGHRDLIDLIWVQPHLALTALEYGCGQPLLQLKRHLIEHDKIAR